MKPSWLKIPLRKPGAYLNVERTLRKFSLYSVCEEAKCPNRWHCWKQASVTVMILGDICTRHCRFCNVKTGNPEGVVDESEPERVSKAIRELGMHYVVLTSVDRDDLVDGGAYIFARTIKSLKTIEDVFVEPLIPDFNGDRKLLEMVIREGPDVVAHNIETVRRLTSFVRDRRSLYEKSMDVLKTLKAINPQIITKSGIMVGLGEELEEIYETVRDLASVGVDILTVGQYLQPSKKQLDVKKYYTPEEFEMIKERALQEGIKVVVSGPFVRSSFDAYNAYKRVNMYKEENNEK